MKSTARGSECKHIGTSSAELQSLHNAFSTRRGWNESPHYWQALNLYGYKKQWETKTRLIWLKALHFSRLCLWLSFLPAPPISPLRLTAGIHFKSLCPLPRKTFWQVVLWTAQIYFFLLQSQKYSLSVLLTLYVLDSDGFSRQTSW